ncbi:MAG: hypothetical protein ACKOYM_07115, partial [Actinomycetes bacterium]
MGPNVGLGGGTERGPSADRTGSEPYAATTDVEDLTVDDAPALKTSVHTAVADNGWRPEHSAGPRSDSHGAVALDSLQRRVRGMHALWLEAL